MPLVNQAGVMIAVLQRGQKRVPFTTGNLQDGQKSAIAANDLKALDPLIKSLTAQTIASIRSGDLSLSGSQVTS